MAGLNSTLVALVGGLAAVYIALRVLLYVTHDPREPPMIETTIPYITPAVGMKRNNRYFTTLRERYGKLPIYTLRLPGSRLGRRLYVINDPKLIAAVQREHKICTFQAIEDKFSQLICDLSPTAVAVQKEESDKWLAGPANASSPAGTTFKALAPGKFLDEMNRTMMNVLQESVENWIPEGANEINIKLFEWIKEIITVPTTEGVYGPKNPYRDAAVRKSYWTYSAGVGTLTMGRLGQWLAPDCVKSRDFLASVFEDFFKKGGHVTASGLTRQRYDWYISRGFPVRDYAQLEAGHGVAILGNTVPTTFWFVLHIFSDPEILKACREEVLAYVVDSKDADGTPIRTLDVMALKASCPLLLSVFKEAMRVHGKGVGIRGVMQDHLLDGKWLVKKDTTIFMPSTVQHFDRERWGADATEYHHDRFTDKARPRVNNISYRAFGGGTTLCPGRHFATTEIMTFAAMLMLRFEMVPKGGEWEMPTTDKARLTSVMPAPDYDIDVQVKRRKGDEGVKWVWKLTESEKGIILGSEDTDRH